MNKNNNSSEDQFEIFTTYDLGVSAALLSAGYKLNGLDRSNPRRSLFIFQHTPTIEADANKYFSDQLQVKARSYFDNLKALKNKLYSD